MFIEAHTIATHSPPRDWLYALVIVKLSSSLPVAALLIGALSLLTGCQPGAYVSSDFVAPVAGDRVPLADIDWLADPHDWAGPSTALLGVADIEPAAINPAQTLPITVESDELGEPLRVTITSTDRLLALDMSGSLAATVWALGLEISSSVVIFPPLFPAQKRYPWSPAAAMPSPLNLFWRCDLI